MLVSFETPQNEVQALDVPLDGPAGLPARASRRRATDEPGGKTGKKKKAPEAANRDVRCKTRSSAPPRATA